MLVSMHQPSYFPWLGLIDKIKKSELYICMDEVQLADRAYQHRNIFLDSNGEVKTLTININKKNYRQKYIKDLELSSDDWQKKHSSFFLNNYKRHEYFEEIYPLIKFIYEKNYKYLIDVLLESMFAIFEILKINIDVKLQSSLVYDRELKKNDLIIGLLNSVSAKKYLSGTGAADYQIESEFVKQEIELIYNSFSHPIYHQNSSAFVEGLSSLDMLFNIGIEESKKTIFREILV